MPQKRTGKASDLDIPGFAAGSPLQKRQSWRRPSIFLAIQYLEVKAKSGILVDHFDRRGVSDQVLDTIR